MFGKKKTIARLNEKKLHVNEYSNDKFGSRIFPL